MKAVAWSKKSFLSSTIWTWCQKRRLQESSISGFRSPSRSNSGTSPAGALALQVAFLGSHLETVAAHPQLEVVPGAAALGLAGVVAKDVLLAQLPQQSLERRLDLLQVVERLDAAAALQHGALQQLQLPAVAFAVAPGA